MRFEHLRTAVQGLRLEPGYGFMRRWLCTRVGKAKWLLWHGRHHECLRRLESLRRDTGWGGLRNPLGSLIRYIESYPDWLIDYGKRYRQHRPISTGSAESAVEYVVDQRMKNKGHMRWSRQGANALLQVRCAVLNGIDMLNFMRWYPRDREHAYPTAPRVG